MAAPCVGMVRSALHRVLDHQRPGAVQQHLSVLQQCVDGCRWQRPKADAARVGPNHPLTAVQIVETESTDNRQRGGCSTHRANQMAWTERAL